MHKYLIIGLLIGVSHHAMSMDCNNRTTNNTNSYNTYGTVEKIEVQGNLTMIGHSDNTLLATATIALGIGYLIGKKDASCVIL